MKEFVVGSPYTSEMELTPEDDFLIMACDGVRHVRPMPSNRTLIVHDPFLAVGCCGRPESSRPDQRLRRLSTGGRDLAQTRSGQLLTRQRYGPGGQTESGVEQDGPILIAIRVAGTVSDAGRHTKPTTSHSSPQLNSNRRGRQLTPIWPSILR